MESTQTPSNAAAKIALSRQYKQMQGEKIPGISCGLIDDNVFEWSVMIMPGEGFKFYEGESGWTWETPILSGG